MEKNFQLAREKCQKCDDADDDHEDDDEEGKQKQKLQKNFTKSNSEFEIQINFCLRVLNLTFSICFMQMMQFFLFRCCCCYYYCCCTFVVVLFVFSIPLAFARSGSRRHDLSGKSSMLN